jgi:glyceraldehyde 3-phosphate dehydrogenase
MINVAINGFGRIGRSVYRILAKRDDIRVRYVNDLANPEALAYLLGHDTVMGPFDGTVEYNDGELRAGTQTSQMIRENIDSLPWNGEVDFVVEATGVFRTREALQKHLNAGANRVILTVPAKDAIDATIVMGVNDDTLLPEHRIISNASCTTNCLAPLAKVLNEEFGIVRGLMNTVHAYTNDQRLSDIPHADLRRSRAASENIIPTTTGAAKAVGKVLPELDGRLDGLAMRVPVADGSIVDLVAEVEKPGSLEAVNDAMRAASEGTLAGVLQYSEAPLVSSDIIGNPHSCVFDSPSTQISDKTLRVLGWYDNEWGYANRVVDLIGRVSRL